MSDVELKTNIGKPLANLSTGLSIIIYLENLITGCY